MDFILLSAAKDLRRRMKDPTSLLLWVGIPLMIGSMMSLMSGGGSSVPRAKVLLVDQDDSFVSQLLAGAGSGSGGRGAPLDIEVVDLEEGRQRIDNGEASALLIVPEGFGEAVLEEQPTTLQLITNPAQTILPRIVEEGLEILVEGGFYVQRLFGDELKLISKGPDVGMSFFPSATIALMSTNINDRMRRLEDFLFPAVLILEEEEVLATEEAEEEPSLGLGIIMLPAMLLMSVLFIAQGMSEDIWKEKQQGTLRRACSSPRSLASFLGGKLAAGAVVVAGVSLVGIVVGCFAFDMSFLLAPVAILWCSLTGAALLSFFILIQTLGKTPKSGNVLTTLVLFPMMMLGGSFFPFEVMPAGMAHIGRWTPNGQALLQLKELLAGSFQPMPLLTAALCIGIPAGLTFFLTVRRVRGSFLGA